MDGGTPTGGAHTESVSVGGKTWEVHARCAMVPIMAESAGMFEWNSGVFCLTVNGAQALTSGTGNQRHDPGPTKGAGAWLRNLFNRPVFSEQESQLRMGL
jgi:hypothetical protein